MNMSRLQTSVAKFGGTSVAQELDTIEKIMSYNNDGIDRKFIVVSAPGKRDSNDVKVTDMLLEIARNKRNSDEDISNIMDRLNLIATSNSKEISNLERILRKRLSNRDNVSSSAFQASIAAFGEEASARLIAERTDSTYINPSVIFRLNPKDKDYSNGVYDKSASEEMIRSLFLDKKSSGEKFIIPGFFGYDSNENIVTFSRGGSDITQAHLAVGIDTDIAENFTDSGILAADPKIVNNPSLIPEITYEELRNLTLAGFSILHKDVVLPLRDKKIPLHIRGTKDFPEDGTYIVTKRISKKPITGIGYKNGFTGITIEKPGLDDVEGSLFEIHKLFYEEGIPIFMESIGVDDGTLIVRDSDISRTGLVDKINRTLISTLGNGTEVNFQTNLGIVSVVGIGMKGALGIGADIRTVLKETGTNVMMSNQTAKEHAISYVIKKTSSETIVNALYDRFIR